MARIVTSCKRSVPTGWRFCSKGHSDERFLLGRRRSPDAVAAHQCTPDAESEQAACKAQVPLAIDRRREGSRVRAPKAVTVHAVDDLEGFDAEAVLTTG